MRMERRDRRKSRRRCGRRGFCQGDGGGCGGGSVAAVDDGEVVELLRVVEVGDVDVGGGAGEGGGDDVGGALSALAAACSGNIRNFQISHGGNV